MLIVFVGDTDSSLAQQAQTLYPSAELITEQNCQVEQGIYYTSLGDFAQQKNLYRLLNRADQLYYCPPVVWSDTVDGHSAMQSWTEFYMLYFCSRKPVHNISQLIVQPNLPDLVDHRQTHAPQVWAVGSDVTAATDLDRESAWSYQLATALKRPLSVLAKPQATVEWCADQILRSDLRAGDVVVWELATVDHIESAVKSTHQVLALARRQNITLIFVGLQHSDLVKYFVHLPNYFHLYGSVGTFLSAYIDKDSSTLWPGPATHQWYANEIYKKFFA